MSSYQPKCGTVRSANCADSAIDPGYTFRVIGYIPVLPREGMHDDG